ncbi:PHP domain-containing protein [Halanaerobacter jeridensis]|uniref:Metal-dependent phosphoesterase TrpH n=1 Tax=Halanaerobacter jeridensis TaxID=706427 RepID=A0A938XVH4_9FIRM|nr:putative metal-dependent phosphoesterase TrpH [Halanaerobacter jeridensis]
MQENYIDLHLHTTASDGNFSPEEVVAKADQLGFNAIAITDHDTIEGIKPALREGVKLDLEVVPGIEINTDYADTEVHVLGYYIDYENKVLLNKLKELKKARYFRAEKIVDKLNDLGIEINFDEVLNLADGAAVGRSHIAQIILEKGYVDQWGEVFDKYIGRKAPAYVERERLDVKGAIDLIKQANGIPVIAHPALINNDELLKKFIKWGAEGIEVYHTEHNKEKEEKYLKFAKEHNLLITGGSDCHGPRRKEGVLLGAVKVSYAKLKKLKERNVLL